MSLLKEVIEDQNMELLKINKKEQLLNKLVNITFKNGKKSNVENKIIHLCRNLKKNKNLNICNFLANAIENVRPYVGFVSKKIGSVTYRVPVGLVLSKEISVALNWIIQEGCGRKLGSFNIGLLKELDNAFYNKGVVIHKKNVLHQSAELNRAYLKFLI